MPSPQSDDEGDMSGNSYARGGSARRRKMDETAARADPVPDINVSPLWTMGGAVSLLATGCMQMTRSRRFEARQLQLEKEKEKVRGLLLQGPDMTSHKFSPRSAHFFGHLSGMIYSPPEKTREQFADLGIHDFWWFSRPEDEVERSALEDTQGAVAATAEYIVLVFRGTQEPSDWATNLKFFQADFPALSQPLEQEDGEESEEASMASTPLAAEDNADAHGSVRLPKVHKGFNAGLDTVWKGEGWMEEKVMELYAESNRPIFVTGHSLGAALATIAAARMAAEHDLPVAALYTVGSPRVFDTRGALAYDALLNHGVKMSEKTFRGVNNNDIVPTVPPDTVFEIEGINYQHVGTKVYINSSGSMETGEFWDGLRGHWEAMLRGAFLDFVDDHDVGKYCAAFERATVKAEMHPLKRIANMALAVAKQRDHKDTVPYSTT